MCRAGETVESAEAGSYWMACKTMVEDAMSKSLRTRWTQGVKCTSIVFSFRDI